MSLSVHVTGTPLAPQLAASARGEGITSGKVRGLLCFRCNTTIGCLGDTKDSVETWARGAVAYLGK